MAIAKTDKSVQRPQFQANLVDSFYDEWKRSQSELSGVYVQAIENWLFSESGIFPEMVEEDKRKAFLAVAIRRFSLHIFEEEFSKHIKGLSDWLENDGLLRTEKSPDGAFTWGQIESIFLKNYGTFLKYSYGDVAEKLKELT